MFKWCAVLIAAIAVMTGCSKSSPSPTPSSSSSSSSTTSSSKPKDAVEEQLQKSAGPGANNCGRVAGAGASSSGTAIKAASDCAMQAANNRQPFYVAYDMPGLTVGIAGAADGKLYTIEAEPPQGQPASGADPASFQVTASPCPATLRVAQSGRLTCQPMGGGMGMGMGGTNPHGGMAMPPSGTSPHGSFSTVPGVMNPHGTATAPGALKAHGENDSAAQ